MRPLAHFLLLLYLEAHLTALKIIVLLYRVVSHISVVSLRARMKAKDCWTAASSFPSALAMSIGIL